MHIVFQAEDAKTLMKSFDLDKALAGEIMIIQDDYSLGPLSDLENEEGVSKRKEWWMKVLNEEAASHEVSMAEDDVRTFEKLKNQMDKNADETIWIWVAANKRDVSGYYWLISQLEIYAGRVFILHLNNLPFINEKGTIFYPEYLHEILPKEFLKAKKLARHVTSSEFEIDKDEWIKLSNENKTIRILEGAKKITAYHSDYFDDSILKFVTADWQKAGKVVNQYLSKSKVAVDESFVLWRMKNMIEEQFIESQGDETNKKEFEIKRPFIHL